MALGGGTFTAQDKILPGSYINVVSTASAGATLGERGYATMPLELDWGTDGKVFTVTASDFRRKSTEIFGYAYTHDKMAGLRDLFANASTLYAYRINSGEKATGTFGTARCSGTRGNDITVVVQENINDSTRFDVLTYFDGAVVNRQTVADATALVNNQYVTFDTTATLAVNAGDVFTGGTNGTADGSTHQAYLDAMESYSFNVMGATATDETTKALYVAYVKRMREEVGKKFQVVLYNQPADYEGVINLKNAVSTADGWAESSLVYWVTGASAGCAVYRSLSNALYDGDFTVLSPYTQTELEAFIGSGSFALHNVNSTMRVLTDINSLVAFTDSKGEIFSQNKVIRVADRIAEDCASLFNNTFLGIVPNNEDGRISLWSGIVSIHNALQDIGAIEDFNSANVTVEQGESKNAVLVGTAATVTGTLEQMYMTVTVS